jgi:hypothetical protein
VARADLKVKLGPGGEILEVPENEELLEEIRETPVLPPADLLNLGVFYKGYSTNEPLGNHLELVALLNIVNDSAIQEDILQVLMRTAAAAGRPLAPPENSSDYWEDFFDCSSDEKTERGGSCFHIRFIPLPNTNLGLLIETPNRKDQKKSYFVIGISPIPASLRA